jgi:hypothetical protein
MSLHPYIRKEKIGSPGKHCGPNSNVSLKVKLWPQVRNVVDKTGILKLRCSFVHPFCFRNHGLGKGALGEVLALHLTQILKMNIVHQQE